MSLCIKKVDILGSLYVLSAIFQQLINATYVSMLVEGVVCEFHFVEGDRSLHPLLTCSGRIGMYVHASRHCWLSFTGNYLKKISLKCELVWTILVFAKNDWL